MHKIKGNLITKILIKKIIIQMLMQSVETKIPTVNKLVRVIWAVNQAVKLRRLSLNRAAPRDKEVKCSQGGIVNRQIATIGKKPDKEGYKLTFHRVMFQTMTCYAKVEIK